MQLAQLEALVAAARTGSFSQAASELFVTQPALTARIQNLERDVGVQLLVRGRHGARLTAAGRALLPFAQRALDAVADGRLLLAEVERGATGQLAIGGAPAVSTYVLPAILERFHALHPGVQLIVRTGHSEEILELVLREHVQIGLVRELEHPDITATPLYDDELVLVTPPRHPFAARDEVGLAEIAGEDLVMFDRTSSYHELTSGLFRSAGVIPRTPMELDNIESAKKMVQQGLGVALLPLIAVADEFAAGTLGTARIAGTPPLARRVVAIRRRDAGPATGIVAALLAVLPRPETGPAVAPAPAVMPAPAPRPLPPPDVESGA